MKKWMVACIMVGLAGFSFAIWPFGVSDEEKNAQFVAELLREPNKIKVKAEILESEGKTDEALSTYAELLGIVRKLEQEHDPAGKNPVFADLRLLKIVCLNSINNLEMSSISRNEERSVSVTQNDGLQLLRDQLARERAAKEGLPPPDAATNTVEEVEANTADDAAEPQPERSKTTLADDLEWAYGLWEDGEFAKLDLFLQETIQIYPQAQELMLLLAQLRLAQERYEDAYVLGESVAADPVFCARANLIAAGAYVGMGQYLKACNALDKVLKLHPAQPAAYFNMAWALSEMGEKAFPDAMRYYRRGVELGGARDLMLERRFNMGEPASN